MTNIHLRSNNLQLECAYLARVGYSESNQSLLSRTTPPASLARVSHPHCERGSSTAAALGGLDLSVYIFFELACICSCVPNISHQ